MLPIFKITIGCDSMQTVDINQSIKKWSEVY